MPDICILYTFNVPSSVQGETNPTNGIVPANTELMDFEKMRIGGFPVHAISIKY